MKKIKFSDYIYLPIVVVIIVLPSLLNNFINSPHNIVRFFLISILSIVWLFINFKHRLPPPYKSIIILLSLFYCYNLLSTFWSLNSSNTIIESQRIGLGIVLIIIFLTSFKKEINYILFLKSYLIFTSFLILTVSYDLVNIKELSLKGLYEINSFFIHKNILASFLFLSLSLTTLSVYKLKKKWKSFSIIVSILLVFLLLILFNRATYLGLTVTLTTYFIFQIKKIKKTITFTLFTFIIIGLLYSYQLNIKNKTHLNTSTESIEERVKVWDNTFKLIKENPYIGIGAGNWQYNYLKHSISDIKNIHTNNITFQKPHNDFLWILSELGSIGFFLFIIIVFLIVTPSLKIILKKADIELSIIISFLIGLAVISFFSFPKERITHIGLTALLLSFILIKTKSTLTLKNHSIFKLFLILILSVNCVLSFYVIRGQYYTKLMLKEKQKQRPRKVIKYGEKSLSVFYNTDYTSTPISSYLGEASLLINDSAKLNYYTYKAYELSPYDFEILSNYAVVLMKNKQFSKAKKILNKAYKINPFSEQVLINLFVLEYNIGNYKTAYNWLVKIEDYSSKHPNLTNVIYSKLKNN